MFYNIFHYSVPQKTPKSMRRTVAAVKLERTKAAALRKAYNLVVSQFKDARGRIYYQPHFLFHRNLDAIWKEKRFNPCTVRNYYLKILLVKSGKFSEKEITSKWTIIYGWRPHQYLLINKKKVDVWGACKGVPFGSRVQF